MNVTCAWCQEVMTAGQPGDETSHGCCPKCLKVQLEAARMGAKAKGMGEPKAEAPSPPSEAEIIERADESRLAAEDSLVNGGWDECQPRAPW
jgi:hypothetical protein